MSLPSFIDVKLKPFDTYNKKVMLYTLEGEQGPITEVFNQLCANPATLVSEVDEGKIPFSPSDSNVWVWKQVAKHYTPPRKL